MAKKTEPKSADCKKRSGQKTKAATMKPWQFQPGQSGNPNGRPPGAVNQLLRMARDAALNVGLPKIIDAAKDGDLSACRTLLQLGLPKLRPVSEPEAFPLEGETLTARATALIDLVSSGEMSSQVGSEVVGILATAARIEEVEQLRTEVDRLRDILEQREGEKHGRF